MKIVQLILFCWALSLSAFAGDVRILAKPAPGANETAVQNAFGGQGATQVTNISQINVRVLTLPDAASTNAINALNNNPLFEFSERDSLVSPDFIPNDPQFASQWNLTNIQCTAAWDLARGSSSVIIAICDTGVDSAHVDLAGSLVPGWNIFDNNSNTSDVTGHGTGIAGVVAAASNNGIGIASIAMNCKVMPLRISDTNGVASFSAMASAVTYAADHGARIVNISYKASSGLAIQSAGQYLDSKGGILTISSGNDGLFSTNADNAYILTVGSTETTGALWASSGTGNNIDLVAPGVSVPVLIRSNLYGFATGTSVSAPMVAAVGALIVSVNPSLTGQQIQSILKNSADDLGTAGWDTSYGWGRVNAFRALQLAGGYTGTISVTATPGCNWAVSVDVPWISIINGASGTGNGTVTYLVANNPTSSTRTGRITAAGKLLIVTQTGIVCTYSISPANASFDYLGGIGTVTLAASDVICAWTVSSSASWITFSPASGSGNGAVNFSVASSSLATTRTGTLTVAGQTFSITQTGDTTAPTVVLTAPANGSTISNIVTITATATDNSSVSRVDFYRDAVLLGTDLSTPYALPFQTTNVANGSYTFYARGFDPANNQGSSGTNTVTISNGSLVNTNVWQQKFGGSFSDAGLAVALDTSDNIYVAGNFADTVSFGGPALVSAGSFDMFLAKYSNAGVWQWSVRYGGTGNEQNITCMAIDPSGNIYVGGVFTGTINLGGSDLVSTGGSDMFLAKYTALGAHVWSNKYGGIGTDQLLSLTAASNGDVIVCGSFVGTVNFGGGAITSQGNDVDSIIVRYDGTGAFVWQKTFANLSGGVDRATGVAVDGSGNVVVIGFFQAQINLGGGALLSTNSSIDIYIAKFTSGGVYTWGKIRGGINTDRTTCLAVDPSNNIIVCGFFQTATDLGGGIMTGVPSSSPDQFIAKYAGTDGSFLWAKIFGGLLDESINSVKTDSSGNIALTGFYNVTSMTVGGQVLGNAGAQDVFVLKYDTAGTLLWAKSFGGAGSDYGYGIAIDSASSPIVTGQFSGSANFGGQILTSSGFGDVYLMRLSP